MKSFNPKSLARFFEGIESYSGIKLSEDKVSLLQNRMRERFDILSITDLDQYNDILSENPAELQVCAELLTTHKTEWFREMVHFEFLQQQLNTRSKHENFSFWSAAASSGQELYTTLFILLKNGYQAHQLRLLGTDISSKILEKARGLPETEEFRGQVHTLKKVAPEISVDSVLSQAIRSSVKFKEFNLVHSPLFNGLAFDFIFLRNVLIYFDPGTIEHVINKLTMALKPGGFLVTGLSEPINPGNNLIKVGPSIYQARKK